MKYKVWFVKYESVIVEAENEEEAIDLADEKFDDLCSRRDEYACDYELDEIEVI